jgi:FkbM family methyltransferase
MADGGHSINPVETIEWLETMYPSNGVNWEAILSCQYRAALPCPRTIIDVGAHQGAHVAHFINMGAEQIVAFEPIPELAALLANKFGCDRLIVHQMALGHQSGRAQFLIDLQTPSESGLCARSDKTGSEKIITIELYLGTIDQFSLQNVDYIKLDAEGAELSVLAGATRTLARWRPLLSIEYGWAGYSSYGYAKRSLLDWAHVHRYVVCDLFGAPLAGAAYDACVDRYYCDFLAVPEEATDLSDRLQDSGKTLLARIEQFCVASD